MAYITYACALAQTTPLLSRRFVTRQWRLFEESVGRLHLGVLYWKVQRFCWPKGTSLECAESIYVKTTETACVSDETSYAVSKKKKKKKKKKVRDKS